MAVTTHNEVGAPYATCAEDVLVAKRISWAAVITGAILA
jgi:hypothetical protein